MCGRPTSSAADQARPDPRSLTLSQLLRHSAYEAVLTTMLLFGVVSAVRWVIGASPVSRAIPGIHLEQVVVGALVGLLLAGLILSPLGKASGGHINPAISLAMWRFGVFPRYAVLPYGTAQLAGSLLGGLIGAAIAGLGTVTGGSVNPARQFGPAVLAGQFGFLATYLLAPLVGAVVAGSLLGVFQRRKVLTHRLSGHRSTSAPGR